MGRIGRPPKPKSLKRDVGIYFKLTSDEKLAFDKKIAESNLDASEFIRQAIFGKNIVINKIIDPGFKMDLGRVGNNLNQIARLFYSNPDKYKISQKEYRMMEEMKDLLNYMKCNI